MSEEPATSHPVDAPVARRAGSAPRVPGWGYLFIAPCAVLALAAIDLGAHDPVSDPVAEGLKQMIAVATCAAAAFGTALVSRLRRPAGLRVAGCAALGAASALTFFWARPPAPAVDWRRLQGSGWSAELPAAPALSRRIAPTPSGEMPLFEAVATARGATFRVQESEPPRGSQLGAADLLVRARAEALRSGRERIVEERPLPAPAGGGEARGLELRFHLDGHDFGARIWAAPPRLLVLTAGPLEIARAEADRFFASFQLEPRR